MRKYNIALGVMLLVCSCTQSVGIREWTQSTRDNYFQSVAPQCVDGNADAKTIIVDAEQTAQTIKGFGTCFNELGWASLKTLPEEELQTIFSELFEPGKGACLNRGRMSMGANDFALDYYSNDDTDGDFTLNDFTIERDKQNVIPMMKWALKYQLELYFFTSPWCPPRWMKTTKHYAERAVTKKQEQDGLARVSMTDGIFADGPLAFRSLPVENDAVPGEEGNEGRTSFNMAPEYLDAYARLFGKFVDAYRSEGINIRMVMPQNEMNSDQPYPSCCWTSKDLNIFIGKYLGPEMMKHDCDVYFGTAERPDPLLVDTLLHDAVSSRFIKGVAFQWAGKDALPSIAERYPSMDLVQSEQECGNGLNNWEGAMHSWDLQRHYLSNGVSQYYYWNTSLFNDKPSRWGWYQNSLVTVDEEKGTWTFTPEYYELKHLSHYVQEGAKRLLLTESTYSDMLGFLNPDGTIVLVIANQHNTDTIINVKIKNQSLTINIHANSINTIVI